MSSLIESLGGQLLGGDTLGQLSRAIGADEASTGKALSAALPMLVGGLAGNSAKPGGAEALAGALDRDHDGSVLDDIGGFLQGGGSTQGAGILKHVFGGRRTAIEKSIGASSGLDGTQISQLLAMAAPLIMGFLGKEKRQGGFDAGALASMLGGARKEMEKSQPGAMGALTGLLDGDGDGSIADDVVGIGSKLLGGFFKRR